MMKVSDPIIFGHAVRAYFADVFERHGEALTAAGLSADDGLGAILGGLERLPDGQGVAVRRSDRRRATSPVRHWPWSTPTAGSRTCTCHPT